MTGRSHEQDSRASIVSSRARARAFNTTVDSFEDQDLSEYTGDTGSLSITQNFAVGGSYGLEHTGDTNVYAINSDGALPATPQQGDRFRYEIEYSRGGASAGSTAEIRHRFGKQNGDFYMILTDMEGGSFELWTNVGSFSRIGNSGPTINPDTRYRVTVDWDDGSTFGGSAGDFTCTITDMSTENDLATVTGNENTYSSGEIGFRMNLGDANYRINTDWWRLVNR